MEEGQGEGDQEGGFSKHEIRSPTVGQSLLWLFSGFLYRRSRALPAASTAICPDGGTHHRRKTSAFAFLRRCTCREHALFVRAVRNR